MDEREYSFYIHKLLKKCLPDLTISKKGMIVMNKIVNHLLHEIAIEAGRIARYKKRRCITSIEMQSAVKNILPESSPAILRGKITLDQYNNWQN